MKTSAKTTQILNVTSAISQQRHQLRQRQQVRQPKPVFIKFQLKYINVNLYSKIFIYAFVQNLRTFWCTFYRPN